MTNEQYLKTIIGADIFKTKNFEDLLDQVDKVRKKLIKLGCFKSVEAVIDGSSNSSIYNHLLLTRLLSNDFFTIRKQLKIISGVI